MQSMARTSTVLAAAMKVLSMETSNTAKAVLVLMAGLLGVAVAMMSIQSSARNAAGGFKDMVSASTAARAALTALGASGAQSMAQLISAFNQAASQAKTSAALIGKSFATTLRSELTQSANQTKTSMTAIGAVMVALVPRALQAGQQSGTGFRSALTKEFNQALAVARSIASAIPSALMGAYGGAVNSGRMIGQGLANGMQSMLGVVRAVAAQLAAAADAAIRAKAKIHSPAKTQVDNGEFWGLGLAKGIANTSREVERQAMALLDVPTPSLPGSGSLNLSATSAGERSGQPLEITLNLGGKLYRAFASDMWETNDRELELREVFSVV